MPIGEDMGQCGSPAMAQGLWTQRLGGGLRCLTEFADGFIPEACQQCPESARRARLISRFSFLGSVFGLVYAGFYLAIGHYWGTAIILVCSAAFFGIPWVMQRQGTLQLPGNALSFILILGFSALCLVEGGVQGHAIAWLATVPLCSLLLVGSRGARWSVLGSFAAGAGIVTANLLGFRMHPTYDQVWEPLVSTAGYLGLVLFMFILGVIFETGRERAFGRMQEALGQLEASNAELVRLNQEKNEFLGIAAHDLKNPLTAVIGNAELLVMSPTSPRVPNIARNIISAGTRMVGLIKDLLDANAIEQGKFTKNIECCDARELIQEVMANNQAAASRKGIALELQDGVHVWMNADRTATCQILDNLLSNALKYSPPGSPVHIEVFGTDGQACVAVRDCGPGISADDQKKLFQKFTRLSARPTAGESSTGLGLSIVKRLAEAMRGTVRCQSTLGSGATFTLALPAWSGPTPAHSVHAPGAPTIVSTPVPVLP